MDESVTDLLLHDLRVRLRNATQAEYQALVLRKFLEAIHLAVGDVFGFDASKVYMDQWTVWMNKRADDLKLERHTFHPDKYMALIMIQRQGNITAHENKEFTLVTSDRCKERFRDIEQLLPILVHDMHTLRIDLEPAILRRRQTAHHLHRAQKLLDAIMAAIEPDVGRWEVDIWPALDALLLEVDPSAVTGLRKNPNIANRVASALRLRLSKIARADDSCPLRVFAYAVRATVDLVQWRAEDTALVALVARETRRLPIFRVQLGTDDIAAGATIRHAAWYDATGRQHPIDMQYPIESSSSPALYREIRQLFAKVSASMRTTSGSAAEMREFVLQLAVPKSSSMQGWESLKPLGPKQTLADEFLAVTIDPLDEDDSPVDMPDPLDSTKMTVLWDADPHELRQKGRQHYVLLAGPPAWQTEVDGLPAILWSVSQKAGVVLMPESDAALALKALELGDFDKATVTWADLLQRIAVLQRLQNRPHQAAYRVFMMDARYSTPPAYAT